MSNLSNHMVIITLNSQILNSQPLLDVVCGKSFFCQTLVLGTFSAVVGVGPDRDAASWGEYSCHLNILRVHKADKVLHYDVDAVFVEVAVIAEAEEIKFKTLALHHLYVGDVGYANLGEVGLTGDGAEGCKLRAVESYPIVVAGMFVYESLEHLRCVVVTVACVRTKGLESFVCTVI